MRSQSPTTSAIAAPRRLVLAVVAGVTLMAVPTVSTATQDDAERAAPLAGKHVAFMVGEGVHDGETFMPMAYLINQGATVTVIGVHPGDVKAYNSDFRVHVQKSVSDVDVAQFDALVIPGGRSPAFLREHEEVLEFARQFFKSGKPVAAICHGPQVLVTAGVLDGFRATAVGSISGELEGAGSDYVDEPMVRDRNLITSRVPGDLPVFSAAIAESLVATGTPAR
jgi:protease I